MDPNRAESDPRANFQSPPGDRIVVVVQKQRSFGPESGSGASVSTSAANKVRRGDIRHAVVVRTVKKYQRKDGSVVKFDDNACVLISKGGDPIGTRLNGTWSLCLSGLLGGCGKGWEVDLDETRWPCSGLRERFRGLVMVFPQLLTCLGLVGIVGAELRDKQWSKILSLAPMHL